MDSGSAADEMNNFYSISILQKGVGPLGAANYALV
jgi:hypothetical protein